MYAALALGIDNGSQRQTKGGGFSYHPWCYLALSCNGAGTGELRLFPRSMVLTRIAGLGRIGPPIGRVDVFAQTRVYVVSC
jgi:hypothetical protein